MEGKQGILQEDGWGGEQPEASETVESNGSTRIQEEGRGIRCCWDVKRDKDWKMFTSFNYKEGFGFNGVMRMEVSKTGLNCEWQGRKWR